MPTAEALQTLAELHLDPVTRAAHAIDGVVPPAVIRPANEEEVAAVLTVAGREGLAVAPRGGGTKGGLGAPLRALDLVLSTAKLNQLLAYEPADLTVTVQAGARLADLQRILGARNQMLAVDPPDPGGATVGGILSTNAMGPRRLAYGSLRDLVLGMRVALTDGRVIKCGGRVMKNVAGYDMGKLFIGSLGTLGVVTEVTFKVRPLPEARETLLARFATAAACLGCAEAIVSGELLPVAVVALNPTVCAALGLSGPYVLAVALEESPANVAYQRTRLEQAAAVAGGHLEANLTDEAEANLWDGIRHGADRMEANLICKVSTVLSHLGAAFAKGDGVPGTAAVAWVGTGQVYLWASAQDRLEEIASRWLFPAEGTVVIERAPSALRQHLPVWGDPGAALPLMAGVKRTFDPAGVLNPGRFIGGL
jgi:glycolate oxidase FAD binding subunit